MAHIEVSTSFSILDSQVYTEEQKLILLPENNGLNVLRELHYPNSSLPKLIYQQNPDKYDNFDSYPLTARPMVSTDQTIGGNITSRWTGYIGDRPVKEYWMGSNNRSAMFLYFLRRLWEYYVNPPMVGYITWWPKDRTAEGYNVEIENLTVGGSEISLDYIASLGGMTVGEVALTLRIISEVA